MLERKNECVMKLRRPSCGFMDGCLPPRPTRRSPAIPGDFALRDHALPSIVGRSGQFGLHGGEKWGTHRPASRGGEAPPTSPPRLLFLPYEHLRRTTRHGLPGHLRLLARPEEPPHG